MQGLRTSVLVESPEHGRILQEQLPGWPLFKGDEQADENASPAEAKIITLSRAASEGVDADVLLRADGGDWNLERIGWPPSRHPGSYYLVDFDDRFDDRARRETRQRLNDYRAHGWAMRGGQ